MTVNVFYNKNKELSYYGLCCGYVQKEEKDEKYKHLYMEHSHFHVRTGTHGQIYDIWETFDGSELTKARKFFRSIKL